MTTCSMSSTASSCAARLVKSLDVTPGRSRPVRVTRIVVGPFIARNATAARPPFRPPGGSVHWAVPQTPQAPGPNAARPSAPRRPGAETVLARGAPPEPPCLPKPARPPGPTAREGGRKLRSRQEQVYVAELVPEVLVLDGRCIAPAQQGLPGESVQHMKV